MFLPPRHGVVLSPGPFWPVREGEFFCRGGVLSGPRSFTLWRGYSLSRGGEYKVGNVFSFSLTQKGNSRMAGKKMLIVHGHHMMDMHI